MESELDRLFDDWRKKPEHKDNCFVKDGLIDPVEWQNASRKVLFVLREAYHSGGPKDLPEGFDLCDWLRKTNGRFGKGRTWPTVADWAYASHHSTNARIPTFESMSASKRFAALCACAIVNLKKSGGKSSSDMDEIAAVVKTDAEELRNQIRIINPQIVICAGTWQVARSLWEPNIEELNHHAFRINSQSVVVSFPFHPSSRFPRLLNYCTLACLLQQAGCVTGNGMA